MLHYLCQISLHCWDFVLLFAVVISREHPGNISIYFHFHPKKNWREMRETVLRYQEKCEILWARGRQQQRMHWNYFCYLYGERWKFIKSSMSRGGWWELRLGFVRQSRRAWSPGFEGVRELPLGFWMSDPRKLLTWFLIAPLHIYHSHQFCMSPAASNFTSHISRVLLMTSRNSSTCVNWWVLSFVSLLLLENW